MLQQITLKKILLLITTFCLILICSYYIINKFSQYGHFSEVSYTPYFWPRRIWLFIHLVAGTSALITGAIQFIKRIRIRYIQLHRRIGYTYLLSITTGAITGFYMAATSHISLIYKAGLLTLAIVWLGSTTLAFISILNKNIKQHSEWMTRSYVVTFSFITFRIVADSMLHFSIDTFENILSLMSWACWSVPLFITEVIIQNRNIVKNGRQKKTNLETLHPI